MEPKELRRIASTGTKKELQAAYLEEFGRDITGCKKCQEGDARLALSRLATALEQTGTNYRMRSQYVGKVTSLSGIGRIWPLTPVIIAKILSTPFAYLLEKVEDLLPAEQPAQKPTQEPKADEKEEPNTTSEQA